MRIARLKTPASSGWLVQGSWAKRCRSQLSGTLLCESSRGQQSTFCTDVRTLRISISRTVRHSSSSSPLHKPFVNSLVHPRFLSSSLRARCHRPNTTPISPNYNPRTTTRMSSNSAISIIEASKKAAAQAAVRDHYPRDAKFVGIGSGSTVAYVVEAIANLPFDTSNVKFVPTGYQSKQLVVTAGLTPVEFDSVPEGTMLDVSFDGADEVDDDLNCIKGGGACLFQEKVVALQARKFVCVADSRKLQSRLLSSWKYIPIEVAPLAAYRVLSKLKELGSTNPRIRLNPSLPKQGPLKTDQAFFLIDAPFPAPLLTKADVAAGKDGSGKDGVWEVERLARTIKLIAGVLDVGIFSGVTGPQAQGCGRLGGERPVAAYFGKPDGSVSVRDAPQ